MSRTNGPPCGLLEDPAAKNSSRAEGLSGNCESSVISGRVHLFGFVSTIKLSSER